MAPRAVLFDFDGVLADSENHHIAAWQRTLSAIGWQVADEVAARAAEVDDREFLRDLFRQRGVEVGDVEGWVRRKQELAIQLLRDSPRLYPGVPELIGRLHGRVRLAVVSGTWRENVEAVLGAAGLAGRFELIVAKEDVAAGKGKPAPDAYTLSVRRLSLRPAEVVAIEDSPTGLSSARAAGISAIAVGHRRTFGEWVGDSLYISGLEPAEGLLRLLELEPAA